MLAKPALSFKKYPPILTHHSPRNSSDAVGSGGVCPSVLRSLPYLGVLLLIWLALVISNYTPGTFLTGWDTLHPEFDYSNYLGRVLSGAWQYHQGLGAVASQAHASELPRLLVLRFLDVFVPLHAVRYAFFFSMLLLGPLGMYALLAYIFCRRRDSSAYLWAFVGSLVYLLNLVVLQQFAVPLEMFAVHYGFLGWFFLTILFAYNHFSRKSLTLFVVVSFFMAPQAHTSTLFVALFLAVFLFLLVLTLFPFLSPEGATPFLRHLSFKVRCRRSLILVVLLVLVNAFWLLPNLYFIFTRSSDVRTAHITRLFSQEAFLNNVQYGDIRDVALLKNFLFNWSVYTGNASFEPLFSAWLPHLKSPVTQGIGFGIFALAVLGVFSAFFLRDSLFLAFSSMLLLSLFFLINLNPPTGAFYAFLLTRIPLFGEAFRFPFTKFSILAMFSYSVMSTYTLSIFFGWLFSKLDLLKPLRFVVGFAFTLALLFYTKPFFSGYLIHPQMRVAIPSRYFELFAFFRGVPSDERIAELPLHTFWGWTYYDWTPEHTGYQGAGFLWFGLRQPLLDREFDRWNLANEQAYRELSYALYSQNLTLFEKVLHKYRIRWLIYDASVIAPGEVASVLFHPEMQSLLDTSPHFSLVRDFGGGLRVYSVNVPKSDAVSVSFATHAPRPLSNYVDHVYSDLGDYITYSGNASFPFAYSIDTRGMLDSSVAVTSDTMLSLKFSDGASLLPQARPETLFLPFEASLTKVHLASPDAYEVLLKDISGVLGHTSFKVLISLPSGSSYLRVGDSYKHISGRVPAMSLGLVYLDIFQSSHAIHVYQPVSEMDLLDQLQIESCADMGGASSYLQSHEDSSLSLHAEGTGICATLPFAVASSRLDQGAPIDLVAVSSDFVVHSNTLSTLRLLDAVTGTFTSQLSCSDTRCSQSLVVPTEDVSRYSWRLRLVPKSSMSGLDVSISALTALGYSLVSDVPFEIPRSAVSDPVYELDFPFSQSWTFDTLSSVSVLYPHLCGSDAPMFLDGDLLGIADSGLRVATHSKAICLSLPLDAGLSHRGFILGVRSRFERGVPLRFCLTNSYSKRCDLYESLPASSASTTSYFVIPPSHLGDSYILRIQAPVFGSTDSANFLEGVFLAPIPYEYLSLLQSLTFPLESLSSVQVLTNGTAYDSGWIALCGLHSCSGDHVRLNDWANGWLLDSANRPISFVFLPQLGEWLGLALLPGIFVAIFKLGHK